jgi:hypothetical protein
MILQVNFLTELDSCCRTQALHAASATFTLSCRHLSATKTTEGAERMKRRSSHATDKNRPFIESQGVGTKVADSMYHGFMHVSP